MSCESREGFEAHHVRLPVLFTRALISVWLGCAFGTPGDLSCAAAVVLLLSISCRKSTAGNPADAPRIAPVPSRCCCCSSDGWIWRNEPPCLFWTVRVVEGPRKKRTNDALTLKDPCPSSARLLDLRGREGVCVRWAGLAAWEYMDGEPPGCQGLDARGGGISPPTWATGPSGWETTQTPNFKSRLPSSTTSPIRHRHRVKEPAPAFHAADAKVA